MPLGQILNEAGAAHKYAYFPLNCMVSLVASAKGGRELEVGLVGREGMVGIGLALGVEESPARAIVQGKGDGIRIPAAQFAMLIKRNPALRAATYRYAYMALAMTMQIAACNAAHDLKPRLARWLLLTRDRLCTDTFEITQEFLGQMLGAQRPSVNLAASALQRRGLITYRRGVLKLRDIPALEASACACYSKMHQLTRPEMKTGRIAAAR
jgi:CRP-like cAMP-binding protein